MPYPMKTVLSSIHVVQFAVPSTRYAFEHGDFFAYQDYTDKYDEHYNGESTLIWWHPALRDFQFSSNLSLSQYIELRKMNQFLNHAYTEGLVTLLPLTTKGDEGRYFVHVEDRWEYERLAKNYFF